MLLPFNDGLVRVGKFDAESVLLADRHYSRQKRGTNQFMPPGKTMVLRNAEGTVVFGWLWQEKRDDGQDGYNCSIFRNESARRSSDIILEAERMVVAEWGQNRGFTYVDGSSVRWKRDPGRCFLRTGWDYVYEDFYDGKALALHPVKKRTKSGLYLLAKPKLAS
jgi:hypothetical protein